MTNKSFLLFILLITCFQRILAQSVGSADGVFDVSDLGAASYSIPIKVPPGFNGLQPNLTASYNSQGGNGILGVGWSLSGISAITRVGKTIYNDGSTNGVTLTTDDQFALDGNRLILTTSFSGPIPTNSYRTEVESFKDIIPNGSLNGTGPESFTATDLEGTVYYYGSSFDSRVTMPGVNGAMAWLLYQVRDLSGNTIQYTYAQSPGEEPRISNITYSKNANASGSEGNNISFVYEAKSDPNFSYVAGGKLTQSYRLKSISVRQTDVTGTTKTTGSYEFRYLLVNGTNPYTKLIKIIENGHELNGTPESFPATEFTYGSPASTLNVTVKSDLWTPQGRSYAVGDYNADGLSDVIDYSTADGGTFRLLLRNQSSGFTLAQTGIFENNFITYAIENAIDKERSNLMYFDYNGDGKSDLIRAQKFVNGSGVFQQVYSLYTSSGNSMTSIGKIVRTDNASVTNPYIFGYTLPFTGDFDGDGRNEVLLLNTYLPQPGMPTPSPNNYLIGEKYCTTVPLNTYGYNAFKAKELGSIGFDAAYLSSGGAKLFVMDYNGDGKSDILALWHDNASGVDHAQTWTLNVTFDANNNPVIGNPVFINVADCPYPTLSHDIFTGDFNGDHVTDYLTFKNADGWKIAYGKGNGMMNEVVAAPSNMIQQSPYYPGNTTADGTRPIIIADFNGDGKDDIFDIYNNHTGYSSNPGANYKFFYSTGNNTFQQESIPSLFNMFEIGKKAKNYWMGDFNGDGQVDFITKSEENNNTPYEFLFRPNETRDLLFQIKDGLGVLTKINYLPLTNSTVYNNQSVNNYTYPYIKKPVPIKVVSSIVTDNGINTTGNTTTYSYRGLKYNAHGKGMLGFDNVRSYNNLTRTFSEKEFEVNTTYSFPYLKNSYLKYLWPNNITEEVLNYKINTYDVYHYGDKRIFPYQTIQQQGNALTGETSTTTSVYYFYNASQFGDQGAPGSNFSGKPFSVTVNKGNGLEISTQSFSYPWRIPTNAAANSGEPIAGQSYINSKPYKVVVTNTRQGQPSYTRTTKFTYDAISGLPYQTINDPSTSNTVTTTFTYDGYRNLIKKMVSAAGLPDNETNMTYDASHRFVVESFNVAFPNIKDKATFDPFTGAKLTETAPDGLKTTYAYDGFGRVKTIYDNNGLVKNISYTWGTALPGGNGGMTNASYYITEAANTGTITYTGYDRLGRKLKTRSNNFQGQWVNVDYSYNQIGQLVSSSKPYFTLGNIQYITQGYDVYGRQTFLDEPSSGMTTYDYSPSGNNYLEVTVTNPAQQTEKTKTDASGAKVQVTDASNTVLSYTYSSQGGIKEVTSLGNVLQTYTYDGYNKLTERYDPNYGTYKYTYNAYGQTLSQTDPKNQVYTFEYDAMGRMFHKRGPEGDYFYKFYNNIGLNCGKMIQLAGPQGAINYNYGMGNVVYSISYDDYGYMQNALGSTYTPLYSHDYGYDSYGRVFFEQLPTGAKLYYEYSGNGDLLRISNYLTGNIFYEKQDENALGQITSYRQASQAGANLTTSQTYDNYNLLTGQKTDNNGSLLRNYGYSFDPATGNLNNRTDNKYGLGEDFSFDNLNRLYKITNTNNPALNVDITFAGNGNIDQKTDAGTFAYDQANRISEITDYQNIPQETQEVSYTPFDKVEHLLEGNVICGFGYWPTGDRSLMETMDNVTGEHRYKIYGEGFEREFNLYTNTDRSQSFVYGPDGNVVGMIAIENGDDNAPQDYFILTDHLGSFTHILDQSGNIVEEKSFDAWGRMRDPQTWEPYPGNLAAGQPAQLFNRGYTGHEHLPEFGIINMNARLYDPVMGRMFSPDVNITGGGSLQGYNRYSYALNNPLSFTDPDGNNPIIVAMAIGAAVSALSYTAQVAWSDGGFSNWNWGQFGFSIGMGTVSGAMTFGIGSAFGGIGTQLGGSTFLNEVARAGAHGTFGFITSGGQLSGFASSAFSSLAGSAGSGIGGVLNTDLGGSLFAAGVGGVSSSISGGSFIEGAANGLIVHLANKTVHDVLQKQLQRVFDNYPRDGNEEISNNEAFARVSPAALEEYRDGNACATRLSLAFAKAGVNIPAGYGGIKDTKGNRIITSAAQMQKFLAKKYGFMMTKYNATSSKNGIYVGLTYPGMGYSGHVTIISPGFNSHLYEQSMKAMYFWPLK